MNDKGLTQAEGAIKKATVIAIAGYIIAFCRLAHYQFDISQLKFSSFPFIFYAGAFCAIYLLLNFKPFNKITTTNRILASLGANSLTIMTIHAPFLWLFRDFIRTNSSFYNTKLGGVISNLITFVIFITLSYLIALGIEQLKKLTAKNHG